MTSAPGEHPTDPPATTVPSGTSPADPEAAGSAPVVSTAADPAATAAGPVPPSLAEPAPFGAHFSGPVTRAEGDLPAEPQVGSVLTEEQLIGSAQTDRDLEFVRADQDADYQDEYDDRTAIGRDWAWIEEWRAGGEPTPWGPGLAISAVTAAVVAVAVMVIRQGLADKPLIALFANLVVVAGLSPALWLSRGLPVLRWVSLGGAVGIVGAWIAVLLS